MKLRDYVRVRVWEYWLTVFIACLCTFWGIWFTWLYFHPARCGAKIFVGHYEKLGTEVQCEDLITWYKRQWAEYEKDEATRLEK